MMTVCQFSDFKFWHLSQSYAGVEIGIEQTTYTVNEDDGSREVCAVLSSGTQIPVSITLVTVDGSATST